MCPNVWSWVVFAAARLREAPGWQPLNKELSPIDVSVQNVPACVLIHTRDLGVTRSPLYPEASGGLN